MEDFIKWFVALIRKDISLEQIEENQDKRLQEKFTKEFVEERGHE